MNKILLCTGMMFLCSCGGTGPVNTDPGTITTDICAKVEKAGREASGWGLRRVGDLSSSAAMEAAKLVKQGSTAGAGFLTSPSAQYTAEMINKYLVNILLKDLNPVVAAAIDIAASILDDVLQVPAETMLTRVELDVLAAFVKGLGEGADDYIAGKASNQPPIVTKEIRNRQWLHNNPRRVPKSVQRDDPTNLENPGYQASEYIPPTNIRGVTCENGPQPGITTYLGPLGTLGAMILKK